MTPLISTKTNNTTASCSPTPIPIIDQLTSKSTTTTTHQHLQLHHNNNSLLGRGMIVSDYVRNYTDDFSHVNYNRQLVEDCQKYSAFNFVSIEIG